MPIVSVSRWEISQNDAQQLVREAAPRIKEHGATQVRLGHIHAGHITGQTVVEVTYPDWQSFGQAMQRQRDDTQYQDVLNQAMQKGKLLNRTILSVEDITT
jgi:hypothetical protein